MNVIFMKLGRFAIDLVLFVSLILNGFTAQEPSKQDIPIQRDELIEDARQLVTILESAHPDPSIPFAGAVAFHFLSPEIIRSTARRDSTASAFLKISHPPIVSMPDNQRTGLLNFAADESMYTLFAFMNASGFDFEHNKQGMHPLRMEVREYLKKRLDPSFVQSLVTFANQHQHMGIDTYGACIAALSSPPEFWAPSAEQFVKYDLEPLPAYKDLLEFASLLCEFHEKSNIHELWEKHRALVQAENDKYRPFGQRVLNDIEDYCRLKNGFFSKTTDQIHYTFCPLMSFYTGIMCRARRNVFIVFGPPSGEPNMMALYHEALHHVINPLSERAIGEVERVRELFIVAREKGENRYGTWNNIVDESLVRTITAVLTGRFYGWTDQQLSKQVRQEYSAGFILCEYFGEELPQYEKSGDPLDTYFTKLLKGIDIGKEKRRWIEFWTSRRQKSLKNGST